ncbi:DUF397 domain-containing protein [Streptomyces sp. GS7]|uniref:DUF397 domain-containing protein n=1 Tax=Streptomyces sp. GS7 TaxID=2692234 RepID=UPI001316EE14|nr:DUF397 domain-containing protein [Streptomyces sp. GS7]QHC26369.1 DUF397 domain-containing protein [Streptomyces sp. GS7]
MNVDLTGAKYFKSKYSGGNSQCVEVAHNLRGVVPVRDSKNPEGPALAFPPDAYSAFIAGVRDGYFRA